MAGFEVIIYGRFWVIAEALRQSSNIAVPNQWNQSATGNVTSILNSVFSQGNAQKHLLVTSTTVPGEDCHACSAGIGAYVFARRGNEWELETEDKEVLQFGSWGKPGKAQSLNFSPKIFGFSLTTEDQHMDGRSTAMQLIAPVMNHYRPVLLLYPESDNKYVCNTDPLNTPCYGSRSTAHFLDTIHDGFFDIEVDSVGTEYSNQVVIPATPKTVYIFSGNEYVKQ